MAEKKEYPRKTPLAPVDDATSAPSKTGASRLSRPTPKPEPKTSKSPPMQGKPEPKTSKTGASPSSRPTPKTPPTSDELERRYDMLRRKDLNTMSKMERPTGYKKGGSIDGCALRGKTRGKMV